MQQHQSRAPSVLFIGRSAWCEHGGIQRFNRRVASALMDFAGVSNVLMIADTVVDVPTDTGQQYCFGFGGSYLRFTAAFIRRAIRSDVLLIGHVNLAPFAAIYRLLRPNGQVVLFAHGIEVWNDPRYRRVRKYEPGLLRWAVDRVAIVSRYSQALMAKGFGVGENRFVLFPNAIDLPIRPAPLKRSGSNILVVARLGPSETEKHVDKVIRALPYIRRDVPNATLTIIGNGALRSSLEALARDVGVAEHVHFAGSVDDADLNRAYEVASAFALPSSKEGFGIVYLEAWSRGLPVVASRFGAAPEVVSDGIDGYTVDPFDIEQLANRLAALLSNASLAARFADAGWGKLKEHYCDQAFRDRLVALCALPA
ncbi:MAG: glycosyltransferase family 4 protein, partial [Sphingobium sp.]